MPPRFSVIIPTRDRPTLLRDAILSALGQSTADLEVIVVDDGSSCTPILPDDPRVRLTRLHAKQGASAARNRGIDVARGQYLCFLDDDDILTPERLDIADEGLPFAPAAICGIQFVSKSGATHRNASECLSSFMRSRWISVGQIVVERSLAPRFNTELRVAEDHDWAIQVMMRCRPCPVDRLGYIARHHPGPHLSESMPFADVLTDWKRMFELRSDFFASRPEHLAWQWRLLGGQAMLSGEPRLARQAFVQSIRSRPNLSAAYHLIRSLRRNG